MGLKCVRVLLLQRLLFVCLNLCSWFTQAAELVAPYVNPVADDVEMILDLAEVGEGDYLIDLGAGDGRFVIAAAQRGARAHGVELDPPLVELAQRHAVDAGVADRVAFLEGDIFAAGIDAATVVTLYLMPEVNLQLRPKLLRELDPGTRVVSNSFDMGDWLPDRQVQGRTSGGALLWFIPANVSGTWTQMHASSPQCGEISIHQTFQQIELSLSESCGWTIQSAVLQGDRISYVAATTEDQRLQFDGRVQGDAITGFLQLRHKAEPAQVFEWRAQRRPSVGIAPE